MAIRRGNDEKIVIIKETVYATNLASYAGVIPLNCSKLTITPNVTTVESGKKTNTNQSTVCDTIKVRTDYDVVLEGAWNAEHKVFFEAYFGRAESTGSFAFPTDKLTATAFSYQILRVFKDSTPKRDQVKGATLTSLALTHSSGDVVRFTATFKASDVLMESTATLTNLPAFASITIPDCDFSKTSAFGTLADVNNWTLTLTNEFADDSIAFENQATRQKEILLSSMGELVANITYDTTSSYDNAYLYGSQTSDTLTFESSAESTEMAINYQITNAPKDTGEKGVYLVDITAKLVVGDTGHDMIAVEIT